MSARLWGALLMSGITLWGRCSPADSAAALGALQAQLRAVIEQVRAQARMSVVVTDGAGRRYFEHAAEQPLVPASVTKLFWSVAALAVFGDSAVVTTRVCADAPLHADGTLRGNLYLVGGGDALLSLQELEELAFQLFRRGLRRVTGAVLADGSLFDEQRNRLQYSGDTDPVEPLPPITALGFERNTVRVILTAARGRISAQTVPASPAFVVDATGVRIGKARRGQRASLRVRSRVRGSVQYIVLSGRVARQGTWSLSVPMEKPEAATAATFAQRLRAVGVRIEGGSGEGRCPPTAMVLAVWERPLRELLSVINKDSDNFVAEHLLKLLGARAPGEGTQAERAGSCGRSSSAGACRAENVLSGMAPGCRAATESAQKT